MAHYETDQRQRRSGQVKKAKQKAKAEGKAVQSAAMLGLCKTPKVKVCFLLSFTDSLLGDHTDVRRDRPPPPPPPTLITHCVEELCQSEAATAVIIGR